MNRTQLTLRLDPNSIRKVQDNVQAAESLANLPKKQTSQLHNVKVENRTLTFCTEVSKSQSKSMARDLMLETPSGLVSATPDLNKIDIFQPTTSSNKMQMRKRKRILEDDESSGEEVKTRSSVGGEPISIDRVKNDSVQNAQEDVFEAAGQVSEQTNLEDNHDLEKYDNMFDETIEQSHVKFKKKFKDMMPRNKRARWSEDGAPFPSTVLSVGRPSKTKKTNLVRRAERKTRRFLKTQEQDNDHSEMLKLIRENIDSSQIPSVVDAGDVIIELEQFNQKDVDNSTDLKVQTLDLGNNNRSKRAHRTWIVDWEELFEPADMFTDPATASNAESRFERFSHEIIILLDNIQPQALHDKFDAITIRHLKSILQTLYPKCALHPTGPSLYKMALRNAPLDIVFLPYGKTDDKSNIAQALSTVDQKDALLDHIKLYGASRFKHIIMSNSRGMITGDMISMFDRIGRRYIHLTMNNPAPQFDASKLLQTWLDHYGEIFAQLVLLVHFIHYTHELEFEKTLKHSRPHEWDTICMVAAFFDLGSQTLTLNSPNNQKIAALFLRFITFWTQWNYHDDVAEFDTISAKYVRKKLTEVVGKDSRPKPFVGNPFDRVSPHTRTFQEQILKLLSNFEQIIQTSGSLSLEVILGAITKKRWENMLQCPIGHEHDGPSSNEMDVDDDQP